MQLQSSTLYGPGLLCSTCALSWVDIALVATAIWWQCCWKITRHYGTEMLSILVWDRRRKPQREERLFETQFHHGEDSIISKGRHFVSFKIQPGEIRALWYFCRATSLKITCSLLLLSAAGSMAYVATPPKVLPVTQVSQLCDGSLATSCS